MCALQNNRSKIKIAFIGTSNPEKNASQIRLHHFAREMAESGHNVTVIVPNDEVNRSFQENNRNGIVYQFLECKTAYEELVRKNCTVIGGKFDVVHLIGIGIRSILYIGRPKSSPICIQDYDESMSTHLDSSLGRRYYYLLERITQQRAHGIVVASRALKMLVQRRRPDMGSRLLYLPIGYDPAFEGESMHLDPLLRGAANNQPVMTWVGSFQRAYGLNQMLDLAAEIKRRGKIFTLFMVGGGPELENTKRIANFRGISDRIIFPGRVSDADLQAYLRVADAFLLPFPDTAQNIYRCPTKLFHYMAYNKPIVTNDVGEVGEALRQFGFYYAINDINSMADACERAMAETKTYDYSSAIPDILWRERTRTYRKWVESMHG